jgi:hypothetical protein
MFFKQSPMFFKQSPMFGLTNFDFEKSGFPVRGSGALFPAFRCVIFLMRFHGWSVRLSRETPKERQIPLSTGREHSAGAA